jgi:hypothetical protein
MKTQARASVARQAAKAVCLGILSLVFLSQTQLAWARQHGGSGGFGGHSAPRSSPAPHGQSQPRPQTQSQSRPQPAMRPGYGSSPRTGGAPARPPYNGTPYSLRAMPQAGPRTAGHLPDWMAQHRNLPVGQQERLLRAEPGFNRLNPGEQQREILQLRQLNQLPEAQRERRLARNEALERLSPGERMRVVQAMQDRANLPPDRQELVRRAFRDLRGVPVDQRETILNSERYSSTFSPQERGILSNILRVEPYEPPE